MASTRTGSRESARRIGTAQAVLHLAKNGDEILKYQTESDLINQCIRNEFMSLVAFKNSIHPPSNGDTKPRSIMVQLIDKALHIEAWTLGEACAWFTGELEGYHYTAYFRTTNSGCKMGGVRISMDEIGHTCLDCG